MSKKTRESKRNLKTSKKLEKSEEEFCPVVRIEDIRRVEDGPELIFSEDEDLSQNESKANSFESERQSKQNRRKRAGTKPKEELAENSNAMEIEEDFHSGFEDLKLEFKIFVQPKQKRELKSKGIKMAVKGSTIWIEDLKEMVKGTRLIPRIQTFHSIRAVSYTHLTLPTILLV